VSGNGGDETAGRLGRRYRSHRVQLRTPPSAATRNRNGQLADLPLWPSAPRGEIGVEARFRDHCRSPVRGHRPTTPRDRLLQTREVLAPFVHEVAGPAPSRSIPRRRCARIPVRWEAEVRTARHAHAGDPRPDRSAATCARTGVRRRQPIGLLGRLVHPAPRSRCMPGRERFTRVEVPVGRGERVSLARPVVCTDSDANEMPNWSAARLATRARRRARLGQKQRTRPSRCGRRVWKSGSVAKHIRGAEQERDASACPRTVVQGMKTSRSNRATLRRSRSGGSAPAPRGT